MWRNISLLAVPLGIALAAACGGSKTSGGSSGDTPEGGAAPGDAGILCGLAPCASSEICCINATGRASCTAAGSCMGSSLSCASKSACSSGQTCCFTYEQEGGAANPFATPSFAAQCQDSCPSTSYVLCTTSADCDNGDTCTAGPYAKYCAAPFEGGLFPFPDGGFVLPRRDAAGGGPADDGSAGDDTSGDDVSTADAASE
jgi:hypothetical protein